MSRMADYHIGLQDEAVNYLASQGIDKDLLWDACDSDPDRFIFLADNHKAAKGRITDATIQALVALAAVDRWHKSHQVVIA